LVSGGDQTYQAAKIISGKDLTITSAGSVTFEGVKDLHQETHTKSNSSSFWTSSKGKGNTDETLQQTALVAQGTVAVSALNGLKIDINQVNNQTVSQSIEAMVKADPSLAWLKEAEAQGNVDWRQVKEVHDSFKYSNSGLGPASQMVLAIALAVAMGPAGLGLGSVSGAAAGSLATTGISSTISNKGNLGLALKDTLSESSLKNATVAAITAGVTANIINPAFSGTQVPLNGLTNGFDLATMSGIGGFALGAGVNGVAGSIISTAINGGSFGRNLAGSLVSQAANVAAAVGFNAIGGYSETQYLKASAAGDTVGMAMWAEGGVARTALHAMLGGTLTTAEGGDFATGAIAAGASQAMASALNATFQTQPELRAAMAQIVGAAAAGLAGKDAAQGGWVAQMGDEYNRQLHQPEAVALTNLKKGLSDDAARRYDAAACALTRCSDSVPVTDPNYQKLRDLQISGEGYTQEKDALLSTNAFKYDENDARDDWLLRNDETRQRIGNGASAVASVVSGASLFVATVAETPLCVTGVGCVAPAITGVATAASLAAGINSTALMMAPYFGTQGANVLASFDPATYPGEVTPSKDLANAAVLYGAATVAAGAASKASEIISTVRGAGSTISGLVKDAVGGLKGRLGLGQKGEERYRMIF
jgi:filamentous hemagglutinin